MVQIVVNFHNGGATVGGDAHDIAGLGTSSVALNNFDDGASTGWSMILSGSALTANSNGVNAQVGGDPSYYSDINTEGNFRNVGSGSIDLTFTIPSNVTSFDLHNAQTTTFNNQDNMRMVCEAESISGYNAEDNTTGQFFDLIGIVPDGSNNALLQLFNDGPSDDFVFWNGFHIDNIQTTGGGLSIPVAQHGYRQRRIA